MAYILLANFYFTQNFMQRTYHNTFMFVCVTMQKKILIDFVAYYPHLYCQHHTKIYPFQQNNFHQRLLFASC